ncbi:PssE/Cps14G family polysaccharide biosynthesis glycosyltransferase [Enterococcus sp. N249-2]
MIFVTLGSQKFQFNRLLQWIDELITQSIINDEVYAQIGYSDYKPKNYKYDHFLDRSDFIYNMEKSSIVISHAGTGSIVTALKLNKKTIVVPRLKKYGEHIDDHQIEITKTFENLNYLYGSLTIDEFISKISKLEDVSFKHFKSNNRVYIETITSFIENEVS